MRLSISCDSCRGAKVKCFHEGSAPCRRCEKSKLDGCTLTDSRASKPREGRVVKSRVPQKRRAVSSESNKSPSAAPRHADAEGNPISALSSSTLIKAVETYRRKFPITNFLHYPSLISDISSNIDSVDPIFLASLLSLCVRFMNCEDLGDEETYAAYARKHLAHRAMEIPSLYLAQSLVMISFYEWGTGQPYQAWMYSGMATYMIQSLLKMADDSMENSPHEFQASQTQYEQLVRTYWCCFAQDCELSSGARQHFALSFSQISVPLPISDRDFNFNHVPERRLMPVDMNKQCSLARNLTVEHGLTIVTRGFDIFVRILRFANEHRRALASSHGPIMCLHQTWKRLKGELDDWRSLQDKTVKYPITIAQAHVALGYGEMFAYINLIYYMSILFLHRDRFLSHLKPHSDFFHDVKDEDQIEPATIKELFEAAQLIGGILSALEASEAPVMTPYSGFSVFVAAHINMYGTIAPQHYPGGLEQAIEEKGRNMIYLERLSRLWPVGRSWWRAVQGANKFYESVKKHADSGSGMQSPRRFALAGTLDEYGDIRSRPSRAQRRSSSAEICLEERDGDLLPTPGPDGEGSFSGEQTGTGSHHELETDMFEWPFIDASWSAGLDAAGAGLDGLWPQSGLFDHSR
ncbi:hypothetical protein N7495_004448 [Penicillium taxi]|uniref:uncharacterized protein n=1 Tax=Penicillium taxi TaxID=168475 RepID=UPI00254509FE|nr:uncharacterized protein N7495_004448 [Penicillium taxi]KAJ5899704.1 hypothetical protein N7495_004448 [Penicillium taxi]